MAESTFFGAASQTTTPRLCTVFKDNIPCERTLHCEMFREKLRQPEFDVDDEEVRVRFLIFEGRFNNEHETEAISLSLFSDVSLSLFSYPFNFNRTRKL